MTEQILAYIRRNRCRGAEIAEVLGLEREAVYQTLVELEARGLARLVGRSEQSIHWVAA